MNFPSDAAAEILTERIGPAPRIALDHAGSGELVVFMHGIGGNRTNWSGQLAAFSRHFHAVAWDARGYGLSDDYDGPLQYRHFCEDLLRVLDHFRAETAHLVGLSMGGSTAQDFYAYRPDRVASLVLADTRPGYEAALDPQARKEFLRLRLEPLLRGLEPKDIAPAVARSLMGPKAGEDIFDRLVRSMNELRKDSYIKALEARGTWRPTFDPGSVSVPVLVVVGADDRLTPPDMAAAIAQAIPGARLTMIADAGHLSNLEQPEAFNAEVLDFLLAVASQSKPRVQ